MVTNHINCIPPTKLDPYFIAVGYGGYSEYKVRDTRTGYTLPNCTAFAEGWLNKEFCRLTGHKDGIVYSFTGNACNFYNDAKRLGLETGKEPREGAIMCWSGGLGHVAICDKVNTDGSIIIAESAYGGTEYHSYRATNANGRWTMSNAYVFLGFIYNPAVVQINPVEPVQENKKKDQIQVISRDLRVRNGASLNADVYGFAKQGYYDVLETQTADGYEWMRIARYQWCAGVKGATRRITPIQVKSRVKVNPEAREHIRITLRDQDWIYEAVWIVEALYGTRALIFSNGTRLNVKLEYLTKEGKE